MANSNIINAVFGSGICAVTTSAFRANYGMVLRFSGIDLPTAFEVDFSNYDVMGRDSITAIGQNNEVQIPDDLWDSGLNIYAYVYLHPTDDSGVTVYTVTIPVLGRPNRTEEEPTPHEQSVIEQAISALNDAVEQTAADVASADASASAAAQSEANAATSERAAAASAGAALASQNAAESAQRSATESASGAAESAESAATSAESAYNDVERAEQAATTATNKATEAATSATTANGAAQTATGKAAQAEQSATAAANSASAAATSASNAAASATAAQTAQTAAETAQGRAEQAAQSVSASAAQIAQNTADIAEILKYDDLAKIIKITNVSTTLGDINTILNGAGGVNPSGDHVFFDLSSLGVMMYLCTIFLDTANGVYKVFDLVSGRYAEGTYNASMLLTMATAQANGLAVQSQIDYLQGEIDELGGKSILANYDVLGDKILDGSSTDIIDAGDIIPINWIASVLGTTTSGLTVACSDIWQFAKAVGEAEEKDYLFVYDGTNWTYNEQTVDLADYALTVTGTPSTGEVMDIKTSVNTKQFTFTSYDTVEAADENVPHNWCVEQTYAPDTKAYDTYEAVFAVYQGKTIPAGNYHFRSYSYRSGFNVDMYFTVTEAIGSADSIVQIRTSNYQTIDITNADGVSKTGVIVPNALIPTVYGTRTAASGAITVAYAAASGVTYTELTDLNVDASDPVVFTSVGIVDKAALGNNVWPRSNLSEYLNDETVAKASVEPTYMLDVPSAYNLGAGWLYGIDPRAYALIQTAKVEWLAGRGNDDFTHYELYTAEQKVFLLSMLEMSFDIQTNEGTVTQLYSDYTGDVLSNDAFIDRVKYNRAGGTLNSYRWSRSANVSNANYARRVTATGSSSSGNANNAYYYAPAFILGKSSNPQSQNASSAE
jgi:pyruvate/2-oxoglutarate dehydrogenase complex dihydrolipoamide acyltransferase (E2) component